MPNNCCPNDKPTCFVPPTVYLFRERKIPKNPKCEEHFGLKDKEIFYLGCFQGVYQRKSAAPDRLVLSGKPPLDASAALLVPASSRAAYVINRAWEVGAITFYELDEKLRPSFDMNIFSRWLPNLLEKRVGVPTNEQVVRCGDY